MTNDLFNDGEANNDLFNDYFNDINNPFSHFYKYDIMSFPALISSTASIVYKYPELPIPRV